MILANFSSLAVSGEISDCIYGPQRSFNIHMRRLHEESDSYVYSWTRKKLQEVWKLRRESKNVKDYEKFIEDVIANLPELVSSFLRRLMHQDPHKQRQSQKVSQMSTDEREPGLQISGRIPRYLNRDFRSLAQRRAHQARYHAGGQD